METKSYSRWYIKLYNFMTNFFNEYIIFSAFFSSKRYFYKLTFAKTEMIQYTISHLLRWILLNGKHAKLQTDY